MQRKHKFFSIIFCICLIVTIVFIVSNVPKVSATTLFTDGFESQNTSAWTGGNGTSGATISVSSTYAHGGTYSFEVTGLTSAGRYGYVIENLNSATTYFQVFVYCNCCASKQHKLHVSSFDNF